MIVSALGVPGIFVAVIELAAGGSLLAASGRGLRLRWGRLDDQAQKEE